MTIEPLPVVGLVRAARRRADCSQRELARRAGVARSTVGRIEGGRLAPSLSTLCRLLAIAGIRLVAVDGEGRRVQPMLDRADLRDGAGRRYPSHLDTILDPREGAWWAEKYGMALPPETFYRDRQRRDAQRRRSVWEVRVRQCRRLPEPPDLRPWLRMRRDELRRQPGRPWPEHRSDPLATEACRRLACAILRSLGAAGTATAPPWHPCAPPAAAAIGTTGVDTMTDVLASRRHVAGSGRRPPPPRQGPPPGPEHGPSHRAAATGPKRGRPSPLRTAATDLRRERTPSQPAAATGPPGEPPPPHRAAADPAAT